MAKPEWGTKRLCPSCGTRFYDMKRSPVDCPSCEAIVPTETVVRTRKSAPAAAKPAPASTEAEKPKVTDAEEEIVAEVDADVEADVDEDNDDDESLIEDTSDLAEDEEVSEIAEHMETDDNSDT